LHEQLRITLQYRVKLRFGTKFLPLAIHSRTVTPLLAVNGGKGAARIQLDTGESSELGRVGLAVHPFAIVRMTDDGWPLG
jgi:hypothetical protein